MLTIKEIEILAYFYTSQGRPYPDTENCNESIATLVGADLVQIDPNLKGIGNYKVTERGGAYLQYMTKLGLPQETFQPQWTMEQ